MKSKIYLLVFISLIGVFSPWFFENLGSYLDKITSRNTINLVEKINLNSKSKKFRIFQIANKVTVKIESKNKGSGVIINKNNNRYTILTTFSLLKDNLPHEELEIITFDGVKHNWESMNIQKIGKTDLAIVTFKSPNYYQKASLGINETFYSGDTLYVSGFPLKDPFLPERFIKITEGTVVGFSKKNKNDGYQLFLNSFTKLGMNGGPIFDKNGKLVAIHGKKVEDKMNFNFSSKNLSENLNIAISINHYNKFLENQNRKESKEAYLTTKNSDNYLEQAQKIFNNETYDQWQNNEEKYNRIIELSQKALEFEQIPEAYYLIAQSNYNIGSYKLSEKNIANAINLDPTNAEYIFFKGKNKIGLRDFKGAVKDLSEAISMDPRKAKYIHMRAEAKLWLRDLKGYLKDISIAIEMDPENYDYIIERATVKNSNGDYEGALEDISKKIGLFSIDPFRYYDRGKLRAYNGDFHNGSKDLRKTLVLVQLFNFVLSLMNEDGFSNFIGEIKFALKDYEGAKKSFQKGINDFPQDPFQYVVFSNYESKIKNYESSIQLMGEAIKLRPDNGFLYAQRGNAKYKKGDYPNALKDFNKSIDLSPKLSRAYESRANTRYKLNDIEGACSDYEKSKENKFPPEKIDKVFAADFQLIWMDFKEINFCKL